MKAIITQDNDGNLIETTIADFTKAVIKQFKIKNFNNEELGGEVKADDAVKYIIKTISGGKELEQAMIDTMPEAVKFITEAIETSKSLVEARKNAAASEKEAKKAAREEEKKKEEEKKAAIAKRQGEFVSVVAEGASLAAEEFLQECQALGAGLPEGISITGKDGRFGINVAKGSSEETIGKALGYLAQKSENSTFLGNQLQFFVGDIVIATVENGVFQTAKDAGKAINKMLEDQGKRLTIGNIDSYKRMAERTPVALRNPKADPTAYLAISNMKTPRKGDDESAADFKKRLAKFEKDREALQTKLANGEIIKRKDILPLVETVLIDNGLAEKKEENAGPTVSQMLAMFFHTSFALDNLVGLHEKGVAVYQNGEKLEKVTEATLTEMRDKCFADLSNALYTGKNFTSEEVIRGYKKKTTKEEVAKDADNKPIMEEKTVKIPVYPTLFCEPESSGEQAAATDEAKA